MTKRRWQIVTTAFMLAAMAPLPAASQNGAAAAATIAPDLAFPTEPSDAAALTREMALLVPEGDGPFPAVALIHQCAGINPATIQRARDMVAAGFVVLMTDSLGPRDVQTVCYGARNGVNFFRGVRDVLQAVAHLRDLPKVDRRRVAVVGFSWGAMMGLMAASPMYRGWLGFQLAPAAIVAHYPGCFTIHPPTGRAFEVFARDADVPLLALLGSADTETPPAECEAKFREAQVPEFINWHVYSGATHCWDCKQIDGLQKMSVRGNQVSYRFDAEVTKNAMDRTLAFLKRAFSTN